MTYLYFFIIMFLFFSPNAYAYSIFSLENFLSNTYHSVNSSLSAQTVFFITLLILCPFVVLMMTCFTRIIIILGFVKNAIGLSYYLSNQFLIGLSLFLTFFVMQPAFNKIYLHAYIPFVDNKINIQTAIDRGIDPLKEFMCHETKKSDLLEFAKLTHIKFKKDDNITNNVPIRILVPVFMINELKTAFKIGLIIFIPFLIIDLLVSSILMFLGITMITPAIISTPLKLIIFVLFNGWMILISSLAGSLYF
ncbi:Flagellar biosynthetic protein FliP [Buchnera aphidicola (Chaitophorus populicola)]|uniref:flagellar type III secretion system pore protein FliP n=1 Tax=Buchnera aphidicola TaxID=9 RepID=UPI003464D0DE